MERDLEADICADSIIMEKIQNDFYAQHVYAAMCNMRWQPEDTWAVLKNEHWTCSWRAAGGIVARLQGRGDYLSWYCSGSGDETPDTGRWINRPKNYVKEGHVTVEIREDFARIGWHPLEWPND